MSNSIFNIGDWENGADYKKNDIVKSFNFYYYCLVDHNSGGFANINEFIKVNPNYWGGVDLSPYDNSQKPYFFWKPSFGASVEIKPNVFDLQYGDGYRQIFSSAINNSLMEIDLTFDNLKESQEKVISHFLFEKSGIKPFLFVPFFPFSEKRFFVCENWQNVSNFYDNSSIKAKFIEVSNEEVFIQANLIGGGGVSVPDDPEYVFPLYDPENDDVFPTIGDGPACTGTVVDFFGFATTSTDGTYPEDPMVLISNIVNSYIVNGPSGVSNQFYVDSWKKTLQSLIQQQYPGASIISGFKWVKFPITEIPAQRDFSVRFSRTMYGSQDFDRIDDQYEMVASSFDSGHMISEGYTLAVKICVPTP